ncbi:MAG TPA: 50S ribosomal protein L15 [Bryobacteraceae bacterium]|nr:50S ribosomal protein L15 [Bryobacteraceae bacterium]
MNLSNVRPPSGQVKKQRRIGQGMGSGRGKYSGRGAKGARSVSGYSKMRGFEGGQMPLHRRMPKRGFTNPFKKDYALLNLGRIEKLEGDTFTPESLVAMGAVKNLRAGLKILAAGEFTRKISVKAHLFSEEAEKKILALGGTVEKIPVRPPGPPPTEKSIAKAKGRAQHAERVAAEPKVKPAAEAPAKAEAAAEEKKPKAKAKAEDKPKSEAKPKAPAKDKEKKQK